MNILDQDIKFLPGVGPNRRKMLSQELSIETFGDLLEYYPYKYVDRSKVYSVHELTGDMPFVQVVGHILSFETFDMGPRKERVVAHFTDGTGIMDLVWFNGGKYAKQNYRIGQDYLVFGKPSVFNNRIQVQHPDLDDASKVDTTAMGMQPYYNTTEKMKKAGLNSRSIERLTRTLIMQLKEPLSETIPNFITAPLHLIGRDEALRTLHYPQNAKDLEKARVRMKFEELFFVQLNILRYASDQRRKYCGFIFNRIGDIFNTFYARNLPFELTGAQKRVMREIRQDVCSGRQMNRLLQGDVGSGKTLVALMTMLIALDNGYQACIMAPTEILAEQHLATIREFLKDMPVRVELLTGIVKGKKRQEVLDGLLSGDVQILCKTLGQGIARRWPEPAPRAGDDGHPHPAHAGHDTLWRPRCQHHRRTAARPQAHPHHPCVRHPHDLALRRHSPPDQRGSSGVHCLPTDRGKRKVGPEKPGTGL